MRASRILKTTGLIATIALLTAGQPGVSRAADASPDSQRRDSGASLTQFADGLSKRYDTKVCIDPALLVVGDAVQVDITHGLEAALDQLSRRLPDTVWRRVYITDVQQAAAGTRLIAGVRALERMEASRLWLDDIVSHRTVELERQAPVAPDFHKVLEEKGFRKRPIYVVYKRTTSGDGMTAEERAIACEQEMASLLETAPDLRGSVTKQSLTWWMSLDPGSLQPLMERLGTAGTDLWSRTDPPQRQEMIGQFKQALMKSSQPGASAGNPSGDTNAVVGVNFLSELERIARRIAVRYKTAIVVDPSIYLTISPVAPAESLDEGSAIADLLRPLKGLAWLRLCVQARPGSEPPSGLQLAAFARSLKRVGPKALAVEDLGSRTALLYSGARPEDEGGKPNGTNGSLIYAEFAGEWGRPESPAQRLAKLMQREQQLMLSMDGREIGQALEQSAHAWQSLDGPARERFMSLPMAAGLMAVWLPMEAKARSGR